MLIPVTFSIRQLTSMDIVHLRQLNHLFSQVFADPESYSSKPPSDAYLSKLLSNQHIIALISVANDQIVGGLVAYELIKFEQERSEIYIYDLAVAPAYRRQGVATALIERLCAIASERDAWVIYVQADYGDDPAIALYENMGAREEVLHFDIPVGCASRT
jgi:aminoglycoside 3-N-acetyltransferase I